MSLRKQAMDHRKHDESMKTMSRKAKARLLLNADLEPFISKSHSGSRAPSNDGSRPGSRPPSVPSSRVGSRAGSRLPSPDSNNRELDSENSSSDDNGMQSDEEEEHILQRLVTKMQDRLFWKGAYEDRLRIVRGVANHLCKSPENDEHIVAEIIPILVKSISRDSGDVARYAARSVAAAAMFSSEAANIFAVVNMPLRNLVSSSESIQTKEAALHAYGVTAYFGGADAHEVSQAMEFLLEIIKSDGESANALDNADVVCAAMVSWAFLSTFLDPDELVYYDALESFEEQLQSSATSVITTAANGIGLLAEAQYGPKELDRFGNSITPEDDVLSRDSSDTSNDPGVASNYKRKNWTLNYDIIQDRGQPIKNVLNELGASSLRRVRRDDRKEVHGAVRDARHALDHPWRGPRFSTTIDGEIPRPANLLFAKVHVAESGGCFRGHRLLKSGKVLDRWWKLQRYTAITHVVQSGINEYVGHCAKVRAVLSGKSMIAPSLFKDISGVDNANDIRLVQQVPEWPVDSDDE